MGPKTTTPYLTQYSVDQGDMLLIKYFLGIEPLVLLQKTFSASQQFSSILRRSHFHHCGKNRPLLYPVKI